MDIFNNIKYKYQRIKRGYSEEDLWDFHSYLCEIIPPALRELKKRAIGCPGRLWDEKKKNDECHKWKEILEEMAQGFEAANAIATSQYFESVKSKKHPGYFAYEINKKKAKQLEKKYERGMSLFSKYFLNLWD